MPVEERFWRVVDRRGFGDCWLFQLDARMGSKGQYGSFGLNIGELESLVKKPYLAHRVAFRLVQGRWPNPYGLHGCDTPLCCNAVNPKHVHEGTPLQNMMERNDRFRDPNQYGPDTELAVLRLMQDGLYQEEIARQLGISRNAVANVVFRALRRNPGSLDHLVETLTEGGTGLGLSSPSRRWG